MCAVHHTTKHTYVCMDMAAEHQRTINNSRFRSRSVFISLSFSFSLFFYVVSLKISLFVVLALSIFGVCFLHCRSIFSLLLSPSSFLSSFQNFTLFSPHCLSFCSVHTALFWLNDCGLFSLLPSIYHGNIFQSCFFFVSLSFFHRIARLCELHIVLLLLLLMLLHPLIVWLLLLLNVFCCWLKTFPPVVFRSRLLANQLRFFMKLHKLAHIGKKRRNEYLCKRLWLWWVCNVRFSLRQTYQSDTLL